MKLIDKVFPKKFKVRIRHCADTHYYIEYSYERFLTDWMQISYWYEYNITHAEWHPYLKGYMEAENFALSFVTIDDVNKHYAPELKKKKEWEERYKAFYGKKVPYYSKTIK